MLIECAGKGVAAAAIGHEVQKVMHLRLHRGAQAVAAGARHRAGRQAAVAVGVERVVTLEVGAGQRPVEHGAIGGRVGHGGV